MIALLSVISMATITVLASCVGIISGFGISTIMMPVLLLFLPFTQAIMLTAIIHWFHNIWLILFFGYGINWRMVFLFGIPGIFTSFVGAQLVGQHAELLSSLFGVFLIIYVFYIYIVPTFVLAYNNWTAVIGGSVSGFCAGIFGIRGAIRSLFLSAFDLPKAVYIGTTGVINLLVDSTRLITYWLGGIRLEYDLVWGLLIFIPASFLGARIGRTLVQMIPQNYFRNVISLFLLIIGIRLILIMFI